MEHETGSSVNNYFLRSFSTDYVNNTELINCYYKRLTFVKIKEVQ